MKPIYQSLPSFNPAAKFCRVLFRNKIRMVVLTISLMMLFSLQSFGSHFRYGTVTWTRISETSTTVTIRLNVSLSWRLGTAPSSARFIISGGNTGFVDVPLINTTDPSGGWTNSSGTVVRTLNKSTLLTTLAFSSCCKISNLGNNGDGFWNVFTIINTSAPGSSPVSTMPAIINMPINASPASFSIPASDPDAGSTLSFRLANGTEMAGGSNPSGLSVDAFTGQLRFITTGKLIGQQFNAMVVVTDNHGNQLMLDFIINMTGPSTLPAFDYSVTPANASVFNVIVGQEISFPIRATDTDAGSFVNLSVSGLPSYITTANFSNAPLPATGNPSQTLFKWTPALAQIGVTVVLNFIATDNVGVQSTTSVTIRVAAEPAPEFVSPTPGEGTLRQIVTGIEHIDEIVASSSLGSNVSIAFATGIPTGAVLSPAIPAPGANPGRVEFTWTPTPADFGQKNLSFQALISSTPTIFSTRSYSLIVNTPPEFSSTPLFLNINDGELFSYAVTINDPDIPFGDLVDIIGRTLPSWLTLTDNGDGTALLEGTPAFADGGLNPVELEAEDFYHHGNPEHVLQLFDINVITCTYPVITCPDEIIADTDEGKCSASVDFSASVTGSPDPSMVYTIGTDVIISPYDFPVGTTEVTATATNTCSTATCTFNVTVNDDELPVITASPDVNTQNDEGVCSSVNVTVWAIAADNCSVAVPTGSRSDGLELDAPYPVGITTIHWQASDINGNPAEVVVQTVMVTNIDPVINEVVSSGSLVSINASISLTTGFTDTNVTSATIDWDDHSSPQTITAPSNEFTAQHAYSEPGVYSPRVNVVDACGSTADYTYNYIVVYDPYGGFVTGGGWINSPAGAYANDPSLTGKANFGFVAKYKKGATVPDGHTEFQFQAGNINFNSTSYEWLVISGYKAQYKGVGTINGSGNYNFMITGIDGNKEGTDGTDKIRIKISDGGTVVYDNKNGTAEDAEDATVLGGGSIMIHDAKSTSSSSARMANETPAENRIEEIEFVVYPNPVYDVIHFTYHTESKSPVQIQVIDLQGKKVKGVIYEVTSDSNYSMDIHDLKLKTGFYLLKLQQDAGVKFIRMIKQ